MPVERLWLPPAPPLPRSALRLPVRVATWPRRLRDRTLRAWLAWCWPDCDLSPRAQVEGPTYWRIRPGARVRLDAGVWLRHHAELLVEGGELVIGADTYIGPYSVLNVHAGLTIGRNCLIAEMVAIRDVDHAWDDPERPVATQGFRVAPTTIGDGAWIGAKSSILRGVRVGAGAIVGAGSVVTRDVPDGCIVAGVPARPIGWRHG